MLSKNSIRLASAARTSSMVSMETPLTFASFCMYSAKSGLLIFIALSGRQAGTTFTSKVGSSFSFRCHSKESIGSSVVAIALTLDCLISPRTLMLSSCSFLLHRFHTSSAVSALRTPS